MKTRKMQKAINLAEANDHFIVLQDAGHAIETFTDYHWRIDGLDVWPSSKKYMQNGVVREYSTLLKLFGYKV